MIKFTVSPRKWKVFFLHFVVNIARTNKVSCTQQIIWRTSYTEEPEIGRPQRLTARTPYTESTKSSWQPTMEGAVNLRHRAPRTEETTNKLDFKKNQERSKNWRLKKPNQTWVIKKRTWVGWTWAFKKKIWILHLMDRTRTNNQYNYSSSWGQRG